MHKFLRAIGFSDITKKDLEMILDEVITRPEIMKITKDSEGNEFAELSGSFAANAGITVRGTYQELISDNYAVTYQLRCICNVCRNDYRSCSQPVHTEAR